MPSEWKEDKLKYKYTPLPEQPKYQKKKQKKSRKKVDHKHNYVSCIFAYHWPTSGKVGYHEGTYCPVCGRIGNHLFYNILGKTHDLPEDLPVFWNVDWLDKYVSI